MRKAVLEAVKQHGWNRSWRRCYTAHQPQAAPVETERLRKKALLVAKDGACLPCVFASTFNGDTGKIV